MARAATAATPRAPQLVPAALLLLLLVAACQRAAGAPVASELRCQCLQTVQRINPKSIQSVKVTSPGPHCDQTEVIATLKNGQAACLNPEAPMVKKIINKMLNKDGPTELISKKLTGDCTSSRPCPTGIKEDKEESSTPKAT